MITTFQRILEKAAASGKYPGPKSADWFRDVAKKSRLSADGLMKQNITRATGAAEVGGLYSFYYDPKHKDTLPFYDIFPMVFPIGPAAGGFLGLNFHYLPYNQRAILMDALYGLVNNKKMDETTQMRLSYDILKNASKYKAFKPTLKHYLSVQVKSIFIRIHPAHWDMALFLPVAKFQGASRRQVWADSRRKI